MNVPGFCSNSLFGARASGSAVIPCSGASEIVEISSGLGGSEDKYEAVDVRWQDR